VPCSAFLPRSAEAADSAISARDCAIASGHDAQNNTVICNFGLTSEQLKELTRAAVAGATEPLLDRMEALGKRLGVTKEAAETLLRIVGEQPDIPDEDLTKALSKVATNYKNLQAQVAAMSTESPVARALVTQAKTEIAAGRLQSAGDLLQELTRYVATLNGTCTKIEAMGVLIDPKICLPEIMNTEYRDGHLAFTFVKQRDQGVAVISFSG
jgi:ribonuclease D